MIESAPPAPRPWPTLRRLGLALVLAPMVLASALTLLAFLAAGSTEATRDDTVAVTVQAAAWFFGALTAFSLTLGTLGVVALRALGWRGPLAWAATGGALGAGLATLLGLIGPQGVVAIHVTVAAGLAWVLFELVRRLAGVGRA